jgi:dimethylargininase
VSELIALTREVSSAIARCELTHLPRAPVDVDVARAQHRAYEQCLAAARCTVVRLDAGPEMADSVFIEDTGIVFDEVAIVTRPGAPSRRQETPAVAHALARYRLLQHIEAPATADGGDVLVVGRKVFVGCSGRTNPAAIDQIRQFLGPLGYTVVGVGVSGCLHLKSAVTLVADDRLLINRDWLSIEPFSAFDLIDVHPDEPYGANALRVGGEVVYAASFPRTRERLEQSGLCLRSVDVSEIAKAEGALTCCSLIFPARGSL